jgi:DNA-binding response OmpR family regulator
MQRDFDAGGSDPARGSYYRHEGGAASRKAGWPKRGFGRKPVSPGFVGSLVCQTLEWRSRPLLLPGFTASVYTPLMNDFARAPRVLIVEDDEDIARALQRSLRMEGYEARIAFDGPEGLEQVQVFAPDLVILDLGLPGLDGIDVARGVRKQSDVPILILTARDAVESRVEGLDVGADDYLLKPFERQELLARLRALLRRRPPRGSAPLRVSDLSLNADTHEVARGEREIELTQREFELLEYLMRNERIVISRQRLLDEVWGYDPFSTTNTIEVFVSNLRRKLEADGEPRLLHTIRGAGYVLRA